MRPYADSREHLLDELGRLDLLIERHVAEWRGETDGATDQFRGLYVSDEEVDRLLQSTHGGTRSSGSPRTDSRDRSSDDGVAERLDRQTARIRRRTRRTVEEGTELRLATLADRFDLKQRHVDVLLVGLAPELDRGYERIYAYLQDDLTETRPTVGLVLRILYRSETDRLDARRLFSQRHPLRKNRLLKLSGGNGDPLPSRFVTVDERIVSYLLGGDDVADGLSGFATVSTPEQTIADLSIGGAPRKQLETVSETASHGSNPLMAWFHGAYGSGTEAAAEALCVDGTPLLTADLGALAGADVVQSVDLLVREACLQGAALHVTNLDALESGSETEAGTVGNETAELASILRQLDRFDGRVFLTGTEPLDPKLQLEVKRHEFAVVHFPTPPYERRKELWDEVDSLPETIDTAALAAKFRLTAGQIDDAVSTASALANGRDLSSGSVYRGCRAQSRETLDSLARKIEPSYTWDDIVLPSERLDHLREVALYVKHQGTVYSEWGFAEKFSLGNGLNVLFTGPSGTGKTMAAEIIAGDVGLDLYKIDLASVVSKYIGETEKNLGRIFDEAENSDAILLFDEADALFGKRSEIKDSHDRYANIEVNYLLQRVEEHDGTVILTTNLKANIDDAFLRRIHVRVDFPPPDRASRERIWRTIFPDETPVEGLELEFLSTFEITGGNIKNIALTAAFLAAEDDEPVRMEHVVSALRREFQKTGRLVDSREFGEYRELVE